MLDSSICKHIISNPIPACMFIITFQIHFLEFAFDSLCNSSCFSLNYATQCPHFIVATKQTSSHTLQNAILHCLDAPIPQYFLHYEKQISHDTCSAQDGDRTALHYVFFHPTLPQIPIIYFTSHTINLQTTVFWDVWSQKNLPTFRGIYCLHLQDRIVKQNRYRHYRPLLTHSILLLKVQCFLNSDIPHVIAV